MLYEFENLLGEFMINASSKSLKKLFDFLIGENLYFILILMSEMLEDIFIYDYEFLYKIAFAYFKCGLFQQSWCILSDILSSLSLTHVYASNVIELQNKIIPQIQSSYNSYPIDSINKIKHNTYALPFVTFSITTCKRLELFKKTMNSFINCCKDIHLITHWICVDDNSSSEDRKEMQELYPFFTFYFKNPFNKGHANSMNLILQNVQTSYLLHMEDDWEFFSQQFYIQQAIEILNEDEKIGQVLFNKNYTEIPTEIIGGIPKRTQFGFRYYLHDYEPDLNTFTSKYGNGPNCGYWPHYSLRPSLLRTNILKRSELSTTMSYILKWNMHIDTKN